jgi:hypothetical protein
MPPFNPPAAPTDSVYSSPEQTNALTGDPSEEGFGVAAPPNIYDHAKLLALFDKCKRESMDHRWIWERDWQRNLYYVSGRQWITYMPNKREWVDKRLHKWIPRPVTNKMAETTSAIRTTFSSVNLQAKVRPVGNDSKAISAAEIADQMAPLIHEEHDMNQVMREADFWLITTGTSVLQTSWDTDPRNNRLFVKSEQCALCGTISTPEQIVAANNVCPSCGSQNFIEATGPDGKPAGKWVAFGKGKTTALSPFEYAFPPTITRWDELPYLIRLRWRDRSWFEANLPALVPTITWETASSDRSLQLFKSLALTDDVGLAGQSTLSTGPSAGTEGVTEYEIWYKPTPDYPEGLVFRVIGDRSPQILDLPDESLPGPMPYTDIEGKPIFPFTFAQYEHIGGRLYGRSALTPLIQKQDQLNQLDSLVQLIVQRMANPIWVIPEGAGVEQFSGEPGMIMKYNPLGAGGNAKPEKIEGSEVPSSLHMLRDQLIRDIEELSGAFDIIKGQKPTGVEAFSALQLLVERSQSRFTSVFQSRGEMYRKWFAIALELERQYGPDQRTMTIVSPNRGFTFKHFEHAQLQGDVAVVIEDGSTMPKTYLGERAAIEQAVNMGLVNAQDPDQRQYLLSTFGLLKLAPSLSFHVQRALQIQDAFEEWAVNMQGEPPLTIKPWYDLNIHWAERIKWLNTDRVKELMDTNPMIEPIIMQHLAEMQMMLMPPPGVGPDGKPLQQQQGGNPSSGQNPGGQAMNNANKAGGTQSVPKGNGQGAQNQGPV